MSLISKYIVCNYEEYPFFGQVRTVEIYLGPAICYEFRSLFYRFTNRS